ncbi:hypothetical protein [Streptomyces sp. NBC_01285]|uniref:hypothetical protein n=1 Tax=unclassified Streptomyces TaxID=2593676 RepID=UPI002257A593|nr:hypothetical protein [Streptomyces sp. NBC_01285]MCX4772913.1 hypothetical protein [Streptomyces sp. NBC_01285]
MTACAIEDGTAVAVEAGEPVEPGSDEPDGAAEPPDPAADATEDPAKDPPADAAGPREPVVPPVPVALPAPARVPAETVLPTPAFTITADGAYAARLTAARVQAHRTGEAGADATTDTAWYPERWTLDGPEPYAVPLPLNQPEEADSQVLPLADGRVLIRRRVADRHTLSLLYPTGPGTGELPLGAVECAELTLLPPSPDGVSAYALSAGAYSTGLWLVAGGPSGPQQIAELPGRCSGGVWLDRAGRLLALDREPAGGGPVKAVAVDLGRGAEMTPLLQIAPDSNDRLLLADPDSGLLLIRSDAPGHDRLGWGVLGSCLPVRFPECLRLPDAALTPFAVQPGQMLMPESCAVALRIDGAAGSWVGVWRPAGRMLHQLPVPGGWLAGSGVWSREGVLRLPYANGETACAVALLEAPADVEPAAGRYPAGYPGSGMQPSAAAAPPSVCKPVPLGQAPLVGRTALQVPAGLKLDRGLTHSRTEVADGDRFPVDGGVMAPETNT